MYFQKFRVQKPEGDFIIAPSITDKNLYICSSVLPNLQLPPTFDSVGANYHKTHILFDVHCTLLPCIHKSMFYSAAEGALNCVLYA